MWGYRIADDHVPEPQLPYEPPRLPADQEAVSFGIAPMVRDGKTERLLPFVAAVVLTVDQTARLITVDWGLDY